MEVKDSKKNLRSICNSDLAETPNGEQKETATKTPLYIRKLTYIIPLIGYLCNTDFRVIEYYHGKEKMWGILKKGNLKSYLISSGQYIQFKLEFKGIMAEVDTYLSYCLHIVYGYTKTDN